MYILGTSQQTPALSPHQTIAATNMVFVSKLQLVFESVSTLDKLHLLTSKSFFLVPAAPRNCNITLSYNQSSNELVFLSSTWDSVPVSHRQLLTSYNKYISSDKYYFVNAKRSELNKSITLLYVLFLHNELLVHLHVSYFSPGPTRPRPM